MTLRARKVLDGWIGCPMCGQHNISIKKGTEHYEHVGMDVKVTCEGCKGDFKLHFKASVLEWED